MKNPMLAGLAVALLTEAAEGQSRPKMPDDAANLVVQVLVDAGESAEHQVGAGIVVAANNRVIVATAEHVVWRATEGGRARVVFRFARGDTIEARVERTDTLLDLAVLSVDRDSVQNVVFAFDREGDPAALGIGDAVIPVGCPNGLCWEPPLSRDRVIAANEQRIAFESFFISPGSSGGALFNQYWEVVGLVTAKEDPEGRAVGIQQVIERLREWGYAVQLQPKRLPRAGYPMRVSLLGLASASGGAYQSGRWPSGRVAMLFRGQHRLGWHVAAFRLAPENLSVSGAAVGVDLRVQYGPIAVTPFVEVGFARVDGRYNAGGYTVADPGGQGQQKIPIWKTATNDVLGVGGGVSGEFALFPHLAVEVLAGHWSFRTDSHLNGLPNVFVGGGVRLGF